MTSDIFIINNESNFVSAVHQNVPEWTLLEQGVYWQGDFADYVDMSNIDIVGMADANGFEAQFLLLP